MSPAVTRGVQVVYKHHSDARAAVWEMKLSRALRKDMMPCVDVYSRDQQYVLVFERATPLTEVPRDRQFGKRVFIDLVNALASMHTALGLAHLSVCPQHVVVHRGACKLVDASTIQPIGSWLRLRDGMRGGFTCADALLGGQRTERRHDLYSAAATALWAMRRTASFRTVHDEIYERGATYLRADVSVDVMRSVWGLAEDDTFLLAHLVRGFERALVDATVQNAHRHRVVQPVGDPLERA